MWDAEQRLDTLYDDLNRIFVEKTTKLTTNLTYDL
jgi:hypothetical protein